MSQTSAALTSSPQWIHEETDGVSYDYLPLGKYVVAARGVCGGRPTIKHHRLDARHVLAFFNRGDSVQQIAENYRIPAEAVEEVIRLSSLFDYEKSYA
ncbi:MAG: DUF433 domain-containing protein [Acidobacteria bacterium]|nr:DUF433 domain-containing protein [Acidobacteriota bacterium]